MRFFGTSRAPPLTAYARISTTTPALYNPLYTFNLRSVRAAAVHQLGSAHPLQTVPLQEAATLAAMEECGSSDDDDPGTLVPRGHLDALHASLQRCLAKEKASREQALQANAIIVALKEEVAQLRASMERLLQREREHTTPASLPPTPTPELDGHDSDDDPPPPLKRQKRLTKQTKPTPLLLTPISNPFSPLSPADITPKPQLAPTPKPTDLNNPTVIPVISTCPPIHQKTDTVPPIILHTKDSWPQVSNSLKTRKASYSRATNTREGIRIVPSTIADYRLISQILTQAKHSFHTFQLPSEKTIKVVIRGVPQSLSNEQVLADLTHQSFVPLQVTRLNGRFDRPAPLILVQVERKFKSIFNLKTLCGLDVTVEAKKIPSTPLQCHKCQRFGHTQPNCHAPYRCMKCAEPHSTHLCTKPSTTPAVCANCNSEHISSHHSCTQNPLNLRKSYANALKPPTPDTPKPTQTPKPQNTPKPNNTATPSFASLSFPLFEALLSSNPTPERITAFTTQLTTLKKILEQN